VEYRSVDWAWTTAFAEALTQVASPDLPPNGIAILRLRKPE
jgi:hypothetical protein